jgi:hypothetical protein
MAPQYPVLDENLNRDTRAISMSREAWKTLFGLKLSRWAGRDPHRRPLPEDCDVVITLASLRAAGVKNPTRTRLKLEQDPRFHHKIVIFPDGRRANTTAVQSYSSLLGVQAEEALARSRANLKVGSQAPIETIVTKPQGSGTPFVPEVWPVPVAPPTLRTDAPLPEARRGTGPSRLERQADHAVARPNGRELYSDLDLESHLRDEVLRILKAVEAPIGRDEIAARIQLEKDSLARALYLLKAEGTIIGETEGGEGTRFLYHVAP